MNQLFELIPIALFFIVYKLYDIYYATAALMVITMLQVAYKLVRRRKVETMQWVTLGVIVVFGSATLLLRDEQFIKWKLSIIEWLFGVAFLGSQFVGDKTFVERMMSASLTLPKAVWRRLNLSWALFFMSVGFINLYVMFAYNTDQWVNFKTFVVPILMLIFIAVQMFYVYRHLPDSEKE
ncbi:MAG: septation protein A [Methylococcales bacterium]|nr:septation protein A [Methylococcales bacterium]